MYEKLKHNNNYLAKALSKEKQNNQSLFTQNVELIGEIQQLHLVCNTRNVSIYMAILLYQFRIWDDFVKYKLARLSGKENVKTDLK